MRLSWASIRPFTIIGKTHHNGLAKALLINGQFFVQAGDHLADTGLGEPLRGNGRILLEALQPAFQIAKLLLSLRFVR